MMYSMFFFLICVHYLHSVISSEKLSPRVLGHFVERVHHLWRFSDFQRNIHKLRKLGIVIHLVVHGIICLVLSVACIS